VSSSVPCDFEGTTRTCVVEFGRWILFVRCEVGSVCPVWL
jgi:hypothetical protein